VAQRVGRSTRIALLFHDRGTRRGWVVSSTPLSHFTLGKDPVPILQEAGWAPGPVWTGGKSRPHRDSIPDRPACCQSLYRLSYPSHQWAIYWGKNTHTHTYIYTGCLLKLRPILRACFVDQNKKKLQTNTSPRRFIVRGSQMRRAESCVNSTRHLSWDVCMCTAWIWNWQQQCIILGPLWLMREVWIILMYIKV